MPERRGERNQIPSLPTNIYFLEPDYLLLEQGIKKARMDVLQAGQLIGDATHGGGETWHDNFAFDYAQSEHERHSRQFVNLLKVKEKSKIVLPDYLAGYVGLGRTVDFFDLDYEELLSYRIGSYMVFGQPDSISYVSPIARILIGRKVNQVCSGKINSQRRSFRIDNIS